MNGEGTKLCVAGTMDDYAAIVSRSTFNYRLIQAGEKPYWSTNSQDGNYCFVSWSGTDSLSAISYGSEKEVARIQVGDHPQRVRNGVVRTDWANAQTGEVEDARRLGAVPATSPVRELADHRLERVAFGRELIAHAHPVAGLNLTLDEAGLLELLEAAGEEAVGHPGYGLLQLGEVERAVSERVEDRPRPSAADQLHSTVVVPTDLSWLGLSPGLANAGLRSHCLSSLPIVSTGHTGVYPVQGPV